MVVPNGRMFGCPVEVALDVIGGKWKTVILARLKDGPMRYGELRRSVPALTDKMLTQRLRELEASGLVARLIGESSHSYAVTPLGKSLGPALEALYDWGRIHGELVGARFRDAAPVLA